MGAEEEAEQGEEPARAEAVGEGRAGEVGAIREAEEEAVTAAAGA